jgi:hypothetical protein
MSDSVSALRDFACSLDATITNIVPTGTIAPFAFYSFPTGWLPCYGTTLDPANRAHTTAVGYEKYPRPSRQIHHAPNSFHDKWNGSWLGKYLKS